MVRNSVFKFDSSREFLRNHLENLPKKGWGEIQKWADHLGIHSSYLSQILAGTKLLNVDQTFRLCEVLGLNEVEIDYLLSLVDYERAGHYKTKKYFSEKMKFLRGQSQKLEKRLPKDKVLTEIEKSIFYSSWVYSAVRLLTSFPEGQSLTDLCEKLRIPKDEVLKILNFLCDAELCVYKKSRYFVGHRKTHIGKDSPHVRKHWTNWHIKAIQRFDSIKDEELVYSAPFSISSKDLSELKEEIMSFIQQFLKRVEKTEPEQAVVLNIDLVKIL